MTKEKRYFSKYNKKEIKKILRELKKENRFTVGYRFLGVLGGFIFRVRSLEFYRHDEFSHDQLISTARFKVQIEEKEKGCAISIEEISSVSWLEIVLIFLLGLAITYITALSRNLEFLSILPTALLIISGVTALFLFIIYCSSKFGDRNKESKNKAEMFLKNRLELEENNED